VRNDIEKKERRVLLTAEQHEKMMLAEHNTKCDEAMPMTSSASDRNASPGVQEKGTKHSKCGQTFRIANCQQNDKT
jgi:hypothetical protein